MESGKDGTLGPTFKCVIGKQFERFKIGDRFWYETDDRDIITSAGFTYRLNMLKPRASTFRGPAAQLYNIFNIVIGLSHLCCHNILYFLKTLQIVHENPIWKTY
jgi:hypothetical protein